MFLAALLALQGVAAESAPVPVNVQASVVLVRAQFGNRGQGRQGSGVVVSPGLVATNAHVVEGGERLAVFWGGERWNVTQVRLDHARDLCLLTVPGLPLPAARPGPEPTDVGQTVFSVGYPGGQGPQVAGGHLLGIWHHGEGRLLQSDAVTQPGSSGGGLFDATGRLLGLTTFTFAQNARLNFSVPAGWIQELAGQTPELPWPQHESLPERPSADFMAELAEDARNWPAWEQVARRWTTLSETDPDAWMALGLALDRLARRDAAAGQGAPLERLAEAVRAYERSVYLRPQVKGWNNLGVALESMNRFGEAERAFLEAVRLDARYGMAWLNLGIARSNAGRFEAAATAFARVVALQPDDARAWIRLAQALRLSDASEAAAEALVIALRYRPQAADLWLDLGLLEVKRNRLEAAKAILARLQAMDSALANRLETALKKNGGSPGGHRRLPTPSKGAQGNENYGD